jgi:phospholipase D1/2
VPPELGRSMAARLARKGVWSVAALHLLPIAGYSTVNAVAGASRVRFAELTLGTALGMIHRILLTLTFVERCARPVQ